MKLDWSEQSSHIRTLFRPWQLGDVYKEVMLTDTEKRLGVRLPSALRIFYRAWGQRRDLTRMRQYLLAPAELVIKADTLIFCAENQGVAYWGVPHEALEEEDPPVVVTESGASRWDVATDLNWKPSHTHLSSFLDELTYLHAFCGGAIHGGDTPLFTPPLQAYQQAWLEESWGKAIINPLKLQMTPECIFDEYPTLYVRNGQAFYWFLGGSMAAREIEDLDEISQRFQLTWTNRW